MALLMLVGVRLAMAGPIISEGDPWRYYKGLAVGPLPDAKARPWTDARYDDAGWSGPAPTPIGYGDGDDATLLPDMCNQYLSVYIRHPFTIANTGLVNRLTLGLDIDDGCVAYINGTEVLRRNLPEGPVTFATRALEPREASRTADNMNSEDWIYVDLDPALLRNGVNMLAISGHNVEPASSDFTLSAVLSASPTLLRGPFIQMPETNGMTVAWRTDALTDSAVDYGAETNYAWGTVREAGLVRDHAILLPNLPAGTDVAYRVRSGGVALFAGSLRTPPAVDQPLRLAVFGDFGAPRPGNTAIAARVTAELPDAMVTVGDNIYNNGQPGSYDRVWFRPYGAAMAREATFPALGNHDANFGNSHWMADNFHLPRNGPAGMDELVYSVDFGAAHLAVINSCPISGGDVASTAIIRAWLTNDLARTDRLWKFVVYHHPPYSSLSNHGEDLNMQAQIVPVIEQFGAIGLQGHNHFYERLEPRPGALYITSGGGGNSLYGVATQAEYSAAVYTADNSFVMLEMAGSQLTIRAINSVGLEVDRAVVQSRPPAAPGGSTGAVGSCRILNILTTNAVPVVALADSDLPQKAQSTK